MGGKKVAEFHCFGTPTIFYQGIKMPIKSRVNEKYQHYKTGKLYEIIAHALHSETKEELVVYKALYHCHQFGNNQIWVRPKTMFYEKIMYEGKTVSRFKLVKE